MRVSEIRVNQGLGVHIKRLACNRREASSSLLHPHCADTHTQHNKKVDEHQIAK